jgi:hypothetical protein
MPSLKEATKKPANVGDPIEIATPAVAQRLPAPSYVPNPQGGLATGSLGPAPASFTTPYDSVRQFIRPGVSQNRFPPLPTKANPQLSAATNSAIARAIAAIPPAAAAVPAVGDGLVHGDAVWEYDSAYSIWRDDFNFSVATPLTTQLGQGQGETGWTTIGTGTNSGEYLGGTPPNLGVYEWTLGDTTANHMVALCPTKAMATGGAGFTGARMPLFDYPGWKMTWIFSLRLPYGNLNFAYTTPTFSLANLSVYVGLGNGRDGTPGSTTFAPRPQQFVGVRYDTDTTSPSIGDTTFHLEACFNTLSNNPTTRFNNVGTNGGNFDTGITPVAGVFYRLDMVYTTAGSLQMTLSGGGLTATTTFTLTQVIQTLTAVSGVASSGATNGLVEYDGSTVSTTNLNGRGGFGNGSIITVAGFITPYASYNGVFTQLGSVGGASDAGSIVSETAGAPMYATAAYTVTGYPAMIPTVSIANDSTGGTNNLARAMAVDYFAFVWNKGLTGATVTDPTQSRYW